MHTSFKRLFSPIQIKSLEIKNRIVFAPMTTGFDEYNRISERSLEFYRSIAAGGAGLIVLGNVLIQPQFLPAPSLPGLYDYTFIPGMRQLVDTVHAYGGRVAAQLFCPEYHYGELKSIRDRQGFKAANRRRLEDFNDVCNRLSLDQIEEIQSLFVDAAVRAMRAGFDMIQIHGDRLIGMFTSPLLNRRTDRYGGSVENRFRLPLEITRKIRAALEDIPLEFKLVMIREQPPMGKGGPTIGEAKILAPQLADAGADSFHITLANHHSLAYTMPVGGRFEYGCFSDLSAHIKSVVPQPVTAVGRIIDPEFAEKMLEEKKADLIGLGRPLICDPSWPDKVFHGRLKEIRYCIMCNHGCVDHLLKAKSIGCTCNARARKEMPALIKKAPKPKRVIIAGGGPAGMEAARVAARRGHDVTIWEKQERLGGQLNLITRAPFKEEFQRLLDYLESEVERSGVKVRLKTSATEESLRKENPDAVLIATGAVPVLPAIPGAGFPGAPHLCSYRDIILEKHEPGTDVAVLGGDTTGIETAELLALKGKNVTIVEPGNVIGVHISPTVLPLLQGEMARLGIRLLLEYRPGRLEPGGMLVTGPNGRERLVECSTVIAAGEHLPYNELAKTFEESNPPFQYFSVGDCARERGSVFLLGDAVYDGFIAGLWV